ncbi:MAG: DNA polymerase IV [Alphaproteobacteria bacterium]
MSAARPDALCRDCGWAGAAAGRVPRCPACHSPRVVRHPELHDLAIAHLDCDAFYATVEKRDDPSIRDRPVIVGGGRRGVVLACCYIARMYGVASAMPMFQARKLCPGAVAVPPDMRKYARVGHEVRDLMRATTPLVEPLSIDEAFLDLSGTERVHRGSPAETLARLARRIESEIGVTASIGLSYNKFLAKLSSNLDKPRGFAVIGRTEALAVLEPLPVRAIWGVGRSLGARLAEDGILTVGALRVIPERDLIARYGAIGRRLAQFSRGEDDRRVEPDGVAKSVSAEETFERDLRDRVLLARALWPLCEEVSARLKKAEIAGRTVTLKLKSARFQLRTRRRRLAEPTQLAEILYRVASALLEPEADGTPFRLIGVGCADLGPAAGADPIDLLDPGVERRARAERALDRVRGKLGARGVVKGGGFRAEVRRRPGGAG